MKFQHFHPPGTSFCSTYSEILTCCHSGGDYGSPLGPPKSTPGALKPEPLNKEKTKIYIFVFYFYSSSWRDAPAGLPEVTFTTRITKYQHFHPPGTSFCSMYNEILTFSLSGGYFYYTYNEISTFSSSRNVFLLHVYWNINIFTQRWLLLYV